MRGRPWLGGWFAAFVLTAVAWSSVIGAHPYHASLAEVDYNRDSGSLEVALRLLPEHLEEVLSQRAGTEVDLDATAQVDQLIVDYLKQTFRVRPAAPLEERVSERDLIWVGKEVSHRAAWLYFEIPLTIPLDRHSTVQNDWQLENRVFFDFDPSQINTVVVRIDGRSSTLTFDVDHAIQALPALTLHP